MLTIWHSPFRPAISAHSNAIYHCFFILPCLAILSLSLSPYFFFRAYLHLSAPQFITRFLTFPILFPAYSPISFPILFPAYFPISFPILFSTYFPISFPILFPTYFPISFPILIPAYFPISFHISLFVFFVTYLLCQSLLFLFLISSLPSL